MHTYATVILLVLCLLLVVAQRIFADLSWLDSLLLTLCLPAVMFLLLLTPDPQAKKRRP